MKGKKVDKSIENISKSAIATTAAICGIDILGESARDVADLFNEASEGSSIIKE